MAYRQTKQRMEGKIERGKGKVNVEEKAMQRGASAYTTWSVEKDGVQGRRLPYGEGGNSVVNFRTCSL